MKIPKESCDPNHYPHFPKTLNDKLTNDKLKRLRRLLWGEQASPMLTAKIKVDKNSLAEMVNMVERRRIYLHVFHRIDMSEYNEIALYCFWILKFQPFYPTDGNPKTANEINAILAYRLLSSCVGAARKANKKTAAVNLKLNEITHAFRYQDISKEAIMLLMASLIEA